MPQAKSTSAAVAAACNDDDITVFDKCKAVGLKRGKRGFGH